MAKYRILEEQIITEDGKRWILAAGETDDDKPSGDFVNGSMAIDVTAKKVYFWKESNSSWGDGSGT